MNFHRLLPLLCLLALLASCGAQTRDDPEVVTIDTPRKMSQAERKNAEFAKTLPKKPYALRVNRTLMYPVQNQRAEDLVDTMTAVVQGIHGPGARVIAEPQSNHLLIYLPPRGQSAQGTQGARGGSSNIPVPRPQGTSTNGRNSSRRTSIPGRR
ncbi:MAG: hypothetical protein AAF517_00935 [Planctomycetota bacterium]